MATGTKRDCRDTYRLQLLGWLEELGLYQRWIGQWIYGRKPKAG